MKLKSLLLFLALNCAVFAEQQIIFIYTANSDGFVEISVERDTGELDKYLQQGWKIKEISGSGAQSGIKIWAIVIEREGTK